MHICLTDQPDKLHNRRGKGRTRPVYNVRLVPISIQSGTESSSLILALLIVIIVALRFIIPATLPINVLACPSPLLAPRPPRSRRARRSRPHWSPQRCTARRSDPPSTIVHQPLLAVPMAHLLALLCREPSSIHVRSRLQTPLMPRPTTSHATLSVVPRVSPTQPGPDHARDSNPATRAFNVRSTTLTSVCPSPAFRSMISTPEIQHETTVSSPEVLTITRENSRRPR